MRGRKFDKKKSCKQRRRMGIRRGKIVLRCEESGKELKQEKWFVEMMVVDGC